MAKAVRNPFSNKIIKKIRAERDVKPDMSGGNRDVLDDGTAATFIIELFLNDIKYRNDSASTDLLNDLNSIVSPDICFEDISVRRDESKSNVWEVFLKESGKGLVALSDSGSGLKTILLVLINILLIPKKEGKSIDKYIFMFEELENNLHPAVQRRLLSYIRKIALERNTVFFITTHSNVVIDLFSKDPNAQIYHVTQKDADATAKHITTYIETSGILDDLDIRASDLLQSNGIIWVEGPSDRIYMNRLIELWSGGSIKEGLNYQCVFYGGRVLYHLSAEMDEDQAKDLMKILLTNRKAIILMDSDKKSEEAGIGKTKERVKAEVENAGGLCWITAGRTIENYIPESAMESLFEMDFSSSLGQYDDYRDYLEKLLGKDDGKFYKNKVLFAEKIRPHLIKEDLNKIYDLDEKLARVITEIKKWNKIE